jgi:hypothetical protein
MRAFLLRLWRCQHGGPLMPSGPKAPPPPPPPLPMPDLQDPAILAAKRRNLEASAARSGRSSTILTGDDYGGDKLGTR